MRPPTDHSHHVDRVLLFEFLIVEIFDEIEQEGLGPSLGHRAVES